MEVLSGVFLFEKTKSNDHFSICIDFPSKRKKANKLEQEEVNERCRERARDRERENQTKFSERMGPHRLLSQRAHELLNDQSASNSRSPNSKSCYDYPSRIENVSASKIKNEV